MYTIMKRLFMIGGVMSVVAIRVCKSWNNYDSKDVDEIVKLNLHID